MAVNVHAIEPFQEQVPLKMATPNITKEQQNRWIPLSSNPKEATIQSTATSTSRIDELIKTEVQKKMQTLLKPSKDEEADQ
jgi:hypothetical protein